ncbi:hypothetical protein KSS87_006935 [Heliosperma pusillum]|nr:hypothetical protein KSS87_006935 [Heliosperma pusillum]
MMAVKELRGWRRCVDGGGNLRDWSIGILGVQKPESKVPCISKEERRGRKGGMGCNTSKLDDEEAVQMCKDRKKFIKQALEHRTKFASGHIAYIQSLKRVSAALREYIEGDEPREFSLDSFITPPYTPIKKLNQEFITISPNCFKVPAIQSKEHSSVKINYYRPSGTPSVSVEERPRSPDTYRVQSYSPVHQYGFDGFFSMESPQINSSNYSNSPYNRPNVAPPSPQNSQWDFFWNPFSSLDYYGYPTRSSLEQSFVDDDPAGLRQVREEEGIPELEEEKVEKKEQGTKGFTVYVNKRPTSMDEVIKDLESQFVIVCNAANELSAVLEANRTQCLTTSSEVTAIKMLNPVALFRSASSRSSSSRFMINTSAGSRDEGYESTSDVSDEPSEFCGSHHSTLDRLYAWEKRLYEEVRSGERVRLSYEKKCAQLKNQAVKGDDPSTIEKTSLAKMWKTMAECHQMQKHTLDEAKLLLAGTPTKLNRSRRFNTAFSASGTHQLARSAANLEAELRNWRACFATWITSQRSYIHAVSSWLLRCIRCEPNTSKLPFSPRHSTGVHPIFGLCIQWTRLLDAVGEAPVLDGMDFFAAGMGSIYAQQLKEDARRASQTHGSGSRRFEDSGTGMEVVEIEQVEEFMTPEKMAEVAVRVLCAGMSVAMSSLVEFAISSADGYAELVHQWENVKWPPGSS